MLRKIALVTAKIALVYTIASATIITADTLHTWTVEYNGNYYEYVADRYDNENSYIITIDGHKIYVRDIIGGENR